MKKRLIPFMFLYLSVLPSVFADVPTAQRWEVDRLLAYVKNSGCIINRNGTDYPAKEGINHIRKKYDYFREDISNTEDFIRLAASRSTLSGKDYIVKCAGETAIKTHDWLLAELKRLRAALIICEPPRPQRCTREYNPVCAILKNGSSRTDATGCTACSDAQVVAYMMGAC